MESFKNKVKAFPSGLKIILIFLPFLGIFYMIFYSPKLKMLKNIQKDIRNLEAELYNAREIAAQIELPGEEQKKRWVDTEKRLEEFPDKINLTGLLAELSKLERVNNITDTIISSTHIPSTTGCQDTQVKMGEYLLTISFQCAYRDLAHFIRGIDTMSNRAVIESIEIQKASPPLISAKLQIRPVGLDR